MILPESLYRPANLAENPPQLFWGRVITPIAAANTPFEFARWPRDRLFLMQHLHMQVTITAQAGASAALNSMFLETVGGVRIYEVDNLLNNAFVPVVPDRVTTTGQGVGLVTAIGTSARGSFNLTNDVRGIMLPFGAQLTVNGSVTGVGSTWQITMSYSGFIIDRGGLIG